MSNLYQPSSVTGTVSTWKRAVRIEISNPQNGVPGVVFSEEIATRLPDGTVVTVPSTTISSNATDMTTTFNLIDTETGSVAGTMTYGQLYDAMYSLYLNLAAQRDAAGN